MCAPGAHVSWAYAHACWQLPGKPTHFPLQVLQGAAPHCWPGLPRVGSSAGRAHGKASGRNVQMYSHKNTHLKTSTPRSSSGCPSMAQRLRGSPGVKWGRSSSHHQISGMAVTCARQLSRHPQPGECLGCSLAGQQAAWTPASCLSSRGSGCCVSRKEAPARKFRADSARKASAGAGAAGRQHPLPLARRGCPTSRVCSGLVLESPSGCPRQDRQRASAGTARRDADTRRRSRLLPQRTRCSNARTERQSRGDTVYVTQREEIKKEELSEEENSFAHRFAHMNTRERREERKK